MGDDDDGVGAAEFADQILDAGGRARIERRGRFVHQQDVGIDRQGAGQAEPLLLAAGKSQGILLEPILDLVPNGGAPQAPLDNLIELDLAVPAVQARTIGNIVVDRFGERVRFLENHADAAAQGDDIDARIVDLLAAKEQGAAGLAAGNQVVHPVDRPQQRAFAAAGRADDRGDLALVEIQRDPPHRLVVAIEYRELASGDVRFQGLRRADSAGIRHDGVDLVHNLLPVERSSSCR